MWNQVKLSSKLFRVLFDLYNVRMTLNKMNPEGTEILTDHERGTKVYVHAFYYVPIENKYSILKYQSVNRVFHHVNIFDHIRSFY